MVARAIVYLKQHQAEDGSFSAQLGPGVTGIVLTGLLKTGRVSPNESWVARGLKYLEKYVKPDGGVYAERHDAYTTSVALMAFQEANRDGRYKQIIAAGQKFLKTTQADEGEGYDQANPFYGGIGYDSKKRPDMSNTQFALEALNATGVPADDPSLKAALVFLSRAQNLPSEQNQLPFADKVRDGGFIYTPVAGGESKAGQMEGGGHRSYGSMTYAGLKSMIYSGVSRDDPRVKAAVEWIRKNFTLTQNPGMPKGVEQQGLFYYYHTLAKALSVWGEDPFVDARGVKHAWRAELLAELARRQADNGSWVNAMDRWFEGDPNLVTGYALMALSYCRPKAAASK
jgi:squalene-hopene/tetraprenyl-beta-curcumene cyclase